jgi:hypothetical protein
MTRNEVPWAHVVAIWWAMAWRAIVVGFVMSYVLTFALGITLTWGGSSPGVAFLIRGGSLILQTAATVWALWFALSKPYRTFSIVIAPQ